MNEEDLSYTDGSGEGDVMYEAYMQGWESGIRKAVRIIKEEMIWSDSEHPKDPTVEHILERLQKEIK